MVINQILQHLPGQSRIDPDPEEEKLFEWVDNLDSFLYDLPIPHIFRVQNRAVVFQCGSQNETVPVRIVLVFSYTQSHVNRPFFYDRHKGTVLPHS
jgi:hypothetical protein